MLLQPLELGAAGEAGNPKKFPCPLGAVCVPQAYELGSTPSSDPRFASFFTRLCSPQAVLSALQLASKDEDVEVQLWRS